MDIFEGVELPEEAKGALQANLQALLDKQAKDFEEKTAGLVKAKEDLLAEKKQEAEKRKAAEQEAKRKAEEKAKAENDFEQLYKSRTEEAESLKVQLAELNQRVAGEKINGEAARLAASLTKDQGKAQLLQEQFAKRLKLTDDGLKVLDANGELTVSSTDELKGQIAQSYAFLVDGSPAKGGGATGTRGGAQADVKEVSRADFDKMDHGERAKFFKEGGKVINDA